MSAPEGPRRAISGWPGGDVRESNAPVQPS
jgi:hypothetical protein